LRGVVEGRKKQVLRFARDDNSGASLGMTFVQE